MRQYINYLHLAYKAHRVKALKDDYEKARASLMEDLIALGLEAKSQGLTLWHSEDDSYFWENRHQQIDRYPTLELAIKAYGEQRLKFN